MNSSSIMQTGGTNAIEDENHREYDLEDEEESSRSMSPVLEEGSNIKKLRVDLTQFMNK